MYLTGRQLGDRDYHGFVALNRARGLKYAGPFEGVSTSLARSQYKKGVGMRSDVIVRDLEGVSNFHVQIAGKRIRDVVACSYCSSRTFCDGVRIHVMRRATHKDNDQHHRKDDNQENDCDPSGSRSLLLYSNGLN